MKPGLFIAFEGIDGSGKSSQAKLLAEKLQATGRKVYTTFEPTDGFIGTMVRDILKGNRKAEEQTIAALFLADRLDHLLNETNGILRKLNEGYTVITDRYYFSSYAYHGTHMDMDWVIESNKMCAHLLRPDITVFIDVPPDICMQRIRSARSGTELYETLDNLRKVRAKYIEAFEKLKDEENVFITDGHRSLDAIAYDIRKEVEHCFLLAKTK